MYLTIVKTTAIIMLTFFIIAVIFYSVGKKVCNDNLIVISKTIFVLLIVETFLLLDIASVIIIFKLIWF